MKQHKFEHYYNQYKNMIHYLLQRYQIKYGYEDYYQLLLIKLWTEIERYDFSKTASLDKYLYTKLKYYLIDLYKKTK
ncbi:sigma factor [Mammaliicoccus sciuri]|uniref:sigma factor n=1 Tax=Mammaliicoccus sciuri TaxID=1296 RepID=UPI001F541933|nr:sigma factor [Mammaliicoccus sciuri]MDQ7129596.1 sigma factor [Mammaliicoccus sciuri]